MATTTCPMEALPNELLAASLGCLSTRELIQVVPVSRCFYTLATRILYRRLIDVSPLPHNRLILDCYHPSERLTTPPLSCRYLGLKRVSEQPITDESLKFSDLSKLYSSYRPVLKEENRDRPRASRQTGSKSLQSDETATQDVYLDHDLLFSQLCAVTYVVKEASKPGFFVSQVNTCDGIIRVWRGWLAEKSNLNGADEGLNSKIIDLDKFLWVDVGKNVGLRFRVVLGPAERLPLLSGPGDDSPVSYTLIYEELVVRTTTLLMAVEASTVQEASPSSKAVIISQI
ncbi:F-box domain containing protein [Metarhizium acridum CQMa 102]|uniref:F-box domain containing protein n=1 Tax=Metarhizium acridum (strain CQMa 102) TaxID=655827 RepID=E9DUH7_METAQ|nr:F-box domain containing protein [Metarhizium acridum CQMa 102]EFY92639.1 F-box domain containing protein [Metarhizium acridum CQMa 102]